MNLIEEDLLDLRRDVVDFLAGDEVLDLTSCDREPIHLSGAIQPHGILIAISEHDFVVRQISANCAEYLGVGPQAALGQALARTLGPQSTARLRDALSTPRGAGSEPIVCYLPDDRAYYLTWHRIDSLTVLELEPAGEGASSPSMTGLVADLRLAMQALEDADGVQELCEIGTREMRLLTGYDRVMVYRFHPDQHGEVVAEARRADLDPFLGLHYPASDIPRQARKLFLLNRIRMIVDVGYEPVALMGMQEAAAPIDLSLSALRSVSPVHLQYLSNMGVAASLTISIMRGQRLWGLVACHHSAPKSIDPQLRAACRILGQVFSMQITAQEQREKHAYRAALAEVEVALVARISVADSLGTALMFGLPPATALTAADGVVAQIDGETVSYGVVPPSAAIETILLQLRTRDEATMTVTSHATETFDDFGRFAAQASGVLGVSLAGVYDDFILWFRGEIIEQVRWAGNPQKPIAADAPAPGSTVQALSPRRSFDVWSQEVQGTSMPWLEAEIDAARAFSAMVPRLLLARARDRLAHMAIHDQLTGLPNRTLLLDRTSLALARQKRAGGEVALLFIDLDRFKLVNDSLGHAAGDDLLRQAAERLTAVVRDSDTVSRIGGDEFTVLCEGTTVGGAHQLAHRVVLAFRQPFELDGERATVTASVGVAVAEEGMTPSELLRDSDTAMYRTKHAGRDSFAPFTTEMRAISLRRVEIEAKLRSAIQRRELSLYFQPVHTAAGVLAGFEALSRWPLPGRGMVSPAEFIPVAEDLNLVEALTEWVLQEGLSALARWRARLPGLDLSLAVNVTAAQMTNDRLEMMIDALLQAHQVPPHALCLEITEGALVSDEPSSQRFLQRMRANGVRLSIDDFGTGFSSLAYLTKLPVHELKIDRAFISALPGSQADVTVVASVVALAHQLGLEALAEGVETDDQLATVRRLGCDLVQGYLLGRPMPAEEIDRFLSTGGGEASA